MFTATLSQLICTTPYMDSQDVAHQVNIQFHNVGVNALITPLLLMDDINTLVLLFLHVIDSLQSPQVLQQGIHEHNCKCLLVACSLLAL